MTCKKCPRCEVEITQQGVVKFSAGAPGTRAKLYARVCQFVLKRGLDGCINKFDPKTESIQELDYYGNF